ncbi:hypothetical protein Purlil1_4821 [Purpureocillium lilacinum]|uniref:Uncharacterized protein n=1 Tax=Purpureocillium lilacinum TaxID=33203 RepID=A0ABR0C3G1_PURLI|nr:hypothetical protein Purlil1_4821 [Purpureocillium lilacinum]
MNNCTSSTYDDDADGVSHKSDVKSIYERVCLAAHVGADTARPIPSPPSRHQHHHHAAGDIGDIGGNSSWSMGRTSSFTHTAFPIPEAKAGAASSPPPISSRGRLVRLSCKPHDRRAQKGGSAPAPLRPVLASHEQQQQQQPSSHICFRCRQASVSRRVRRSMRLPRCCGYMEDPACFAAAAVSPSPAQPAEVTRPLDAAAPHLTEM